MTVLDQSHQEGWVKAWGLTTFPINLFVQLCLLPSRKNFTDAVRTQLLRKRPQADCHEVKKGWNVCWRHIKKWTTYPLFQMVNPLWIGSQ